MGYTKGDSPLSETEETSQEKEATDVNKTALASGAILMLPILAACGTHSAAKAKAGATSLANNPGITHDKKLAEKNITSCAGSTNVVMHPHKNRPAFLACLKGKSASPAQFDNCIKSISFGGGYNAIVVKLANCMVQK